MTNHTCVVLLLLDLLDPHHGGGGGSSGYATPTNELSGVFDNPVVNKVLSIDNVAYSTQTMTSIQNPGYIQLSY